LVSDLAEEFVAVNDPIGCLFGRNNSFSFHLFVVLGTPRLIQNFGTSRTAAPNQVTAGNKDLASCWLTKKKMAIV